MEPSLNQTVAIPDGVMVRDLGEESVLLNLDSESYFGLDAVGTRMWKALTVSSTIQGAYEQLLTEYDVEPQRLRSDLVGLVDQLAEERLITLRDG